MSCCNRRKAPKPTGSKVSKEKKNTIVDKAQTTGMTGNRTQTFTLRKPSGSKEVYGSKLEAQAAQVRKGGSISF